MDPIRNFIADYEQEIAASQTRPLLHCRDCGEQTVPDVKFDTDKLCDKCIQLREEYQAHRDKLKAFRERQKNGGLPEDFHHMRLQDYKLNFGCADPIVISQRQDILTHFTKFCSDSPSPFTGKGKGDGVRGALICGPAGVGKTDLTARLYNRFCYHGYRPTWINGNELDTMITDEWKISNRERFFKTRIAEEISQYEIVFIEDLKISTYDWYVKVVNDITNELLIRKRLLFITTNHRRFEPLMTEQNGKPVRGQVKDMWLEKAYTEAFTSRLKALCQTFPLTGPDLRDIHP